jgi:hypothetical protein
MNLISQEVMIQRNEKYGNAWLLTGKVTNECFRLAKPSIFINSELSYNWQIIVCKMMRCIWSPLYDDNWIDTLNYAKLIVERVKFDLELESDYKVDLKTNEMFNKVQFVIKQHTDHPNKLLPLYNANVYKPWAEILTDCMALFRFPNTKSTWHTITVSAQEALDVIRNAQTTK